MLKHEDTQGSTGTVAERASGASQTSLPVADHELIEAAQAGSVEAREHLAREYSPHVYRLALQLTGNASDAGDLTQDVLIKFFDALDRFDSKKPVLPWLRRITRNASVDRFRRKKVRRADSLDTDGYDGEAMEVLSPSLSPEAIYARKQLQQSIWSSLGRLKPNHREILVLRDYQDLAYAEIAEVLDVPIGTVMSRLHAARKHLRNELLESGVWSES